MVLGLTRDGTQPGCRGCDCSNIAECGERNNGFTAQQEMHVLVLMVRDFLPEYRKQGQLCVAHTVANVLSCVPASGGNTMTTSTDPAEVAEIFADIADMFSEAIDVDGLSTLLTYCLEVSQMQDGVVILLGEGHRPDTVVDTSGRIDSVDYPAPVTAGRAVRTLTTEVSITADSHDPRHEYAFPLRVRGSALGVIHLVNSSASPLDERELSLLQSIADIVATTIDQTHRLMQARTLVTQLQGALDSRVVIEQAKGIIAARQGTDVSRAFSEIRSIARREQRPVRSVASEIVSSVTAHSDASSGVHEE